MEVTLSDFTGPPINAPHSPRHQHVVVGPVSVTTPGVYVDETGRVIINNHNNNKAKRRRRREAVEVEEEEEEEEVGTMERRSGRSGRKSRGDRKGGGGMMGGRGKITLRYASDSKESGWLLKEAGRSKVAGLRKGDPEKRLYFKLRGSTLTAHLDESYPEIWRSSVKDVRHVDEYRWRINLKLEKKDVELRAQSASDFQRWVRGFKKAAGTSFEQHYKKVATIGKGHFSVVYVANDRRTGEKFAVKVIKKDKRDVEKSKKFIRREVKILSTTNHDNIIKAVDFFSCQGKPHIVLEFVQGGSLRDMISKLKVIPEPQTRGIFRGIMEGVHYLHGNNIVHRDMKPENILMAKGDVPKITDFGLATFKNERKNIHSVVGTPSYVAPELILNIPYGPPADIWSCGIILYYMLSGTRPFSGDTREKMKKSVLEDRLSFPNAQWGMITPEARHLVSVMLDKNQDSRVTARQVLIHPWFVKSFAGYI